MVPIPAENILEDERGNSAKILISSLINEKRFFYPLT
jgi:hypothetical protein